MTLVQVGVIGRAHGIRGDLTVSPSTDDPDLRFATGSVLTADPATRGPLTVGRVRRVGGNLVVGFDGIVDRNHAETFRGVRLLVDVQESAHPGDEDDFYDHQLIGLRVVSSDGEVLGEVVEVLHPPASPVLEVRRPDGSEELVPFVAAIVPDVDLAAGRLTVLPPDGMFA